MNYRTRGEDAEADDQAIAGKLVSVIDGFVARLRDGGTGLVRRRGARALDVQIYRGCEALTEVLIYGMVVFSPWAFGTTEAWSIWTMNVGGYVLGALLGTKLTIRWSTGYSPGRWSEVQWSQAENGGNDRGGKRSMWQRLGVSGAPTRLAMILAALTAAILVYCLIGAVNARSIYHRDHLAFEYRDCVKWLPHSYDAASTWFAFWTYLGLACSFWAVRDWLLGKSSREEVAQWQANSFSSSERPLLFPARLRRLLWLLAINGGLLAFEGTVQRLEDSPKLLFLVLPQIHQTADTQFGPYAYRANAAQYFNLIWPVCIGFWWTMNRTASARRTSHHWLLVLGLVIAASPIISTSRGGALITVGIAVLSTFFLLATHFIVAVHRKTSRHGQRLTLAALLLFFVSALGLGFGLGWKALEPRLRQIREGYEGREQMYETVRRIAADYPLFGTGPGTYENVSELYRPATDEFWPAQAHNDWLELRATFGWAGSALVLSALGLVPARWFVRGGIHAGRRFITLLWLAMAGCLIHARFDFPFQVHSILFLFLVLCAILANLSRRAFAQNR